VKLGEYFACKTKRNAREIMKYTAAGNSLILLFIKTKNLKNG
jgi:hypothetical protein